MHLLSPARLLLYLLMGCLFIGSEIRLVSDTDLDSSRLREKLLDNNLLFKPNGFWNLFQFLRELSGF